jgi:hypothetical protein
MDDKLSRERLRSLIDDELIALLRSEHCELFIGRTGQFSLLIDSNDPELALPALVIREVFRRRARLEPFARVNGIRLRCSGGHSTAA